MATVTCTLNYENNQLTKTYQVSFDAKDTIKVVTLTPGLAIKATNASARKLFPALTNGMKKTPRSKATPNAAPKYELDVPVVKPSAKKPDGLTAANQPQFCFSAQKLATFLCGRRVNGKFESYEVPDGPTFPNGK